MDRLLKKFRMQGRREEETGAYWVVREDLPKMANRRVASSTQIGFRVPSGDTVRFPTTENLPAPRVHTNGGFLADGEATPQLDFFSSLQAP